MEGVLTPLLEPSDTILGKVGDFCGLAYNLRPKLSKSLGAPRMTISGSSQKIYPALKIGIRDNET